MRTYELVSKQGIKLISAVDGNVSYCITRALRILFFAMRHFGPERNILIDNHKNELRKSLIPVVKYCVAGLAELLRIKSDLSSSTTGSPVISSTTGSPVIASTTGSSIFASRTGSPSNLFNNWLSNNLFKNWLSSNSLFNN